MDSWKKLYLKIYILSLIPLILAAIFYTHLPAEIPLGWSGGTDVSNGAKIGIWPLAACAPIAVVLVQYGSLVNPKKREARRGQLIYPALSLLLVLIIIATVIMSIIEGISPGYTTQASDVMLFLGLFVIFCGMIMSQIRWKNGPFFKSPWTLSSEKVWDQTHAFGGLIWGIGGACLAVLSFFIRDRQILSRTGLIVIIVLFAIPFIRSRAYYYQLPAEERKKIELEQKQR